MQQVSNAANHRGAVADALAASAVGAARVRGPAAAAVVAVGAVARAAALPQMLLLLLLKMMIGRRRMDNDACG